MKKRTTLLVLLLYGIIINGFAQKSLSDIYHIDLGNNQVCELLFYSNGKYEIYVSNKVSWTMTETTILSCGAYTWKKNQIILQDANIGLEMQCKQIHPDELVFTKGFTFLLHNTFKSFATTYESEIISSNYSAAQLKHERETYKKSHPNRYKLYYSQYSNGDYVLDIQKEYRYVLRYRCLIISEGTWKKEGNELFLIDNSLQYTFTVLIGKEGLIGKYLPGNFSDLILYEKNYPFKKEIVTIHFFTHRNPVIKEHIRENEPFRHVEEMPQFAEGGDNGLRQYLKKNTTYSDSMKKDAKRSRVIVQVVIEKDGSIGNVEVSLSMNESCDKEAIRVVKSMPKWIPGRQNGVPVSVYYTIAVNFD